MTQRCKYLFCRSCYGKIYAAEVAMEVTTKCVQLHGGYGYIREYDVERMMRDAKITENLRRNIRSSAYGYFWCNYLSKEENNREDYCLY